MPSANAYAKLARAATRHGRLDILLTLIESGAYPTLGNGSARDDLALYVPTGPGMRGFRLPDATPPALHDSTSAESPSDPSGVAANRMPDRDASELVQFLVDHSLSMESTPHGLDALDQILLKVLETPPTLGPGIQVARYLIDHGAPVALSHRQLARVISTTDPDGYERLIEAVPELRPPVDE